MIITDAELNALADFQASRITQFSLHTGATGTTGASEAAGGGYARVDSNFTPAGSTGPMGSGAQPATPGVAYATVSFPGASAGTYPEVGMWYGTTFISGDAFPAPYTHTSGATPTWSVSVGPAVSLT